MIATVRRRYPNAQYVADKRVEMIVVRRFLPATTCAEVVALIDAGVRPSTITDVQAVDPGFRTSQTCDLFPDTAHIAALDGQLAAALGLDPAHGEPMQGQRYLKGQEFKFHTDYFEPASYSEHCGRFGQRTWTAMVYLDVPQAGGATRFKVIGKQFEPEVGKLVAWNNVLADGTGNYATLHAGLPVRAGVKHVVTKWFRERAVSLC